ncbi:hypothetical protein BpHYR1_039182 [Brachionus plicatilis]|uniref:Uncharacterized protein n=1 Tax=Brachionus plicatilis TaxID=10195 RepID=A0A3M7PA55_BRAPC|nr:hypothetical protein BpHYR1_039182 [Brachionus plicatilis]
MIQLMKHLKISSNYLDKKKTELASNLIFLKNILKYFINSEPNLQNHNFDLNDISDIVKVSFIGEIKMPEQVKFLIDNWSKTLYKSIIKTFKIPVKILQNLVDRVSNFEIMLNRSFKDRGISLLI